METQSVTPPSHLPFGFHWVNDLVQFFQISSVAKRTDISREAKKRLLWMDHFQRTRNARLTCRHFGIQPKTFYKWKKRFNPSDLTSLEDRDRTPHKRRQREITCREESQIVALRRKYIRLGKEKLSRLYQREYGEKITCWKIQKVIERKELYHNAKKVAKTTRKRLKGKKKRRTIELKKEQRKSLLLCLDTIVLYFKSMKFYIFTAIDYGSKVAFARVYKTKASRNSKDFLTRLIYLWGKKIRVANDNGSEFHGEFLKACEELGIPQYWSRVKTPKDNAVNERFNRTLEEEFLELGNSIPDIDELNRRLTEWLIHYNFERPHTTLHYQTPIEYLVQSRKLLPMYSSHTAIGNKPCSML